MKTFLVEKPIPFSVFDNSWKLQNLCMVSNKISMPTKAPVDNSTTFIDEIEEIFIFHFMWFIFI